jgi:hypothetical protein
MDSVNIVRLIKAGWKESAATHIAPVDEQRLLDYVTTSLKHCFCVVAEADGRLLGSIAMVPIQLPWAAKNIVVMAEAWYCVQTVQRRETVKEVLLQAVEQFLDQTRHTAIMGTSILAPPDLTATMAKRPGYIPSRQVFLSTQDFTNEEGEPVASRQAAK